MWARPRSYFAYWRFDASKNAYFAEARPYPAYWRADFAKSAYFAEARRCLAGPPHAGAILGPSCEGLTSAGGLFSGGLQFWIFQGSDPAGHEPPKMLQKQLLWALGR